MKSFPLHSLLLFIGLAFLIASIVLSARAADSTCADANQQSDAQSVEAANQHLIAKQQEEIKALDYLRDSLQSLADERAKHISVLEETVRLYQDRVRMLNSAFRKQAVQP